MDDQERIFAVPGVDARPDNLARRSVGSREWNARRVFVHNPASLATLATARRDVKILAVTDHGSDDIVEMNKTSR